MDILKPINSKAPKPCFFCNEKDSKYSCPRCGEHYCSLDCYKSEKHAECSESFYRDCVTEEMTSFQADDASRKKMMEILNKLHKDGIQIPEELNINENESEHESANSEEELDSDDDEFIDLEQRVADVNLDDAEALWSALTEDERNEFEALVSGGGAGDLVPAWEPWWGFRKESKLVEEVKDNREEEEAIKMCPAIRNVPELTAISKTKPSECVKYNIINVIASYVFTMRYFNGETNSSEFIAYFLSICGNLEKNHNYDNEETAVKSVQQECINSTIIDTDNTSLQVMKEDVYLVLKGPSKENKLYYCNSALSHLHKLFFEIKQTVKNKNSSSKHKPQNEQFSKKFPDHGEEHLPEFDLSKIKNYSKKIEYYLSYLKSYGLPTVV